MRFLYGSRAAPNKHNDRNTKGGRGSGPRPAREGKRTYDRRSGTGRGKEIKKGGGGAHNWGNDKNLARNNEGAVSEGQLEVGDEAAKAEELAEEEKVQVEEPPEDEEEEDKTLSYDEYMKQKARPNNEIFAPPKERAVTNEFANVKPKVAVEEDFLVMGGGGRKRRASRSSRNRLLTLAFGWRNPTLTRTEEVGETVTGEEVVEDVAVAEVVIGEAEEVDVVAKVVDVVAKVVAEAAELVDVAAELVDQRVRRD